MPSIQIKINAEVPPGADPNFVAFQVFSQLALRSSALESWQEITAPIGARVIGECHYELVEDDLNDQANEINNALEHEGWAIHSTLGTDDAGDWRIERDDELGAFLTDQAVWEHVYDRAMQGSKWHKAALEFIANNNVTEWELIKEHIPALRSTLE